MNKIKSISIFFGCIIFVFSFFKQSYVGAFAPTNFFIQNDPFFRLLPPRPQRFNHDEKKKQEYIDNVPFIICTARVESGQRRTGLNLTGERRSIFALYEDTQSAVAMLKNPIGDVKQKVDALVLPGVPGGAQSLTDDGKSGHASLKGQFEEVDVTFFTSARIPQKLIPGNFFVSCYLPLKSKQISEFNVSVMSQAYFGPGIAISNFVKNLNQQAKDLGGLSFNNWSKSGFADPVLELSWQRRLAQQEGPIKVLSLFASIGTLFPIASHKDENEALALSLGNDGAWAFPIKLALELDFEQYFRMGLYLDFLTMLEESRVRRLKTEVNQTEFLLLNKGNATKHHGVTGQFEVCLEAVRLWRGLCAKLAYQFIKHQTDRLTTSDPNFNNDIINTARSLNGWEAHNAMLSIGYDFSTFGNSKNNSGQRSRAERIWKSLAPQFSLFYKFPIYGKAIIDSHTFGAQLGLSF